MEKCRFKIYYQHEDTGHITYKIITLGQPIPHLGERWFVIGKYQYSGLKNKNKKDIWAGDIIKMNTSYTGYCGDEYGEDEDVDRDYIGEVVILASKGTCLKKPYWIDNLEDNTTGRLGWYKPVSGCNSETIGNVIENIELLV